MFQVMPREIVLEHAVISAAYVVVVSSWTEQFGPDKGKKERKKNEKKLLNVLPC